MPCPVSSVAPAGYLQLSPAREAWAHWRFRSCWLPGRLLGTGADRSPQPVLVNPPSTAVPKSFTSPEELLAASQGGPQRRGPHIAGRDPEKRTRAPTPRNVPLPGHRGLPAVGLPGQGYQTHQADEQTEARSGQDGPAIQTGPALQCLEWGAQKAGCGLQETERARASKTLTGVSQGEKLRCQQLTVQPEGPQGDVRRNFRAQKQRAGGTRSRRNIYPLQEARPTAPTAGCPRPSGSLARATSLIGWCPRPPSPHSPQGHWRHRPGGAQGLR